MWRRIEELPMKYTTTNKMFVVISINREIGAGRLLYTSDPYCVWKSIVNVEGISVHSFARWPHPYPPTHFMELPEKNECN